MKATMKKSSPMKQGILGTAIKKVTELAASAKAKKEATTKSAPKTKTAKPTAPEGKPNAATIKVTKTTKATKTPAMQMKKASMGKKC
jgi:hypothetical protein